MVTVPACSQCNGVKSKNDDYLRDMLVVDICCSEHPVAKALLDGKVARSIRRNSSIVGRTVQSQGRIWPKYTPGDIHLGHDPTVKLEIERVEEIFRTMVRGLYFKLHQKRLPDDYVFRVSHLSNSEVKETVRGFNHMRANEPYILGTGVFACLHDYDAKDEATTYWLLSFYNGVFVTISTEPPNWSQIIRS